MIIVGHRGARQEAPENTVPSFEHAYANGCRYFELDVQLSKDQKLMVFHDTSLKRTTGKRGKLSSFNAASLEQLDARQNTPGWDTPCPIPRLEEVIAACPDVEHWQLEVKSDSRLKLKEVASQLDQIIRYFGLEGRAAITSSNRWILKHLNETKPSLSTGIVVESVFRQPVKDALSLGCDYLILNKKLAKATVIEAAHKQNLHVSVWTVNDISEMEDLKTMNVDSIITDIPTMALKHF